MKKATRLSPWEHSLASARATRVLPVPEICSQKCKDKGLMKIEIVQMHRGNETF